VHDLTLEAVLPVEVREVRVGEHADAVDDHRRLERVGPVRRVELERPAVALRVEGALRDVAAEAGVGVRAVLLRHLVEVAAHLRAAAEVLGPAVLLLERELVGDRDRVDAHVGVAVDRPRAARFGAALEDDVREPEQLALHRHRQTAEPAADDRDQEVVGEVDLLLLPLGEEREVLERRQLAPRLELQVVHLLLGGQVHQVPQLVGRGLGDVAGAGVVHQPVGRLGDQQFPVLRRHQQRLGQRFDLGVVGVLVQRYPDRVEVGELDGSLDEVPVNVGRGVLYHAASPARRFADHCKVDPLSTRRSALRPQISKRETPVAGATGYSPMTVVGRPAITKWRLAGSRK
jgi:hypothetical protein